MNNNDKQTNALNLLLSRSYDAKEGYREAAEKINNKGMSDLFKMIAKSRDTYATALTKEIKRLGGDPDFGTSVQGDLHRSWIKIKDLFVSGDEQAILAECIRGEEHAAEDYKKVMEDQSYTFGTKTLNLLGTQYLAIKEDIKRLKRLTAIASVA